MSDSLSHSRQLVGIAKTWALKTLPGWSDDIHRDLLARHGATAVDGRVSAGTLDRAGLAAVLADYERRGWPRQRQFRAGGQAKTVPPRIAHLVRLWGRLGAAGGIEHATRPALLAFCARQTGQAVADLDALTPAQCQAITEALKAMLARAG